MARPVCRICGFEIIETFLLTNNEEEICVDCHAELPEEEQDNYWEAITMRGRFVDD